MTDVLTYSAGARDAAVEETRAHGEARRRPPTARGAVRARARRFGRERRRRPSRAATVNRLRPGRPFRLLDPPRRAREARREFRGARAATCAGATARACLSSAAAECRDGLSLFVGARLSRRQRQYRAPAASDQRAHARHRRPLPRAARGSRGRVAIVRSLSRRRAILAPRSPPGATRASSGAATPRSRCSPPCPCAMAESRSGSATAFRSRRSTAPRSTSWTSRPFGRSPRNCTTTCSSSTRWPARRRMRSMSSATPRPMRPGSGASSTHPRSSGRWTIPRPMSGTRSAR